VAAEGKGVHTGLLADSAPLWVERLNPDAVTDKDQLLRDQFLENLYHQPLRQDTNTQQWWQPGCFGCGSRTHIREDCPAGGRGRNQRGGTQNNRRLKYKPPALNEKTPQQ